MGRLRTTLLVVAVAAAAILQLIAAQEAPGAPPPPAVIVLPLPQNPSTDCGKAVFHEFSKRYRSCFQSMYHRLNPSEDCCSGYAAYYGVNSTLPSRNCFCDPDVWAEFDAHHEIHSYEFADAFLYCGRFGYVIPVNAEEGRGYCYGNAPDMEEIMGTDLEHSKKVPTTTISQYVKKLNKDGLAAFSFGTSILSAIGFLFVLWPTAFDAVLSCMEFAARRS